VRFEFESGIVSFYFFFYLCFVWRIVFACLVVCMEASLARVSQSGLKTGGGATTSGACGTIAEVASEAS
jgi:hypothetical protein